MTSRHLHRSGRRNCAHVKMVVFAVAAAASAVVIAASDVNDRRHHVHSGYSAASSSSSSSSSSSILYSSPFTSSPIQDDLLHLVEECDRSISCAGISLEPNSSFFRSPSDGGGETSPLLYRHSFVGPYRTPRTYETRAKDYTYHRGRIMTSPFFEDDASVLAVRDDVTVHEAKALCTSGWGGSCVAFTYPVRSLENLDRPSNVTFVSEIRHYRPLRSDEWRTYVHNARSKLDGRVRDPGQLRYDPDVMDNPYRTCCDTDVLPDMDEVRKVDTLERISCDITREEFFLSYELPRIPVMLVGCEKDWPAVTERRWTVPNLIPRFGNDTRWRARIGGDRRLDHEDYNHNVKWRDIADAMRNNKPYYLFDQLEDPEAKSVDHDYDDPLPMRGGDLYRRLPYFNGPLRWFCVGPGGTGTMSHMDPYGTDAWNTLIQGHKWWVIYPEGYTDNTNLECDESCSVESPLTLHWYASVGINAARSEYGINKYGRHVLQKTGETIYVPDGLIHSVYNFDNTIAITRNYASAANLDEVWMETVLTGDPEKWRRMYYDTLNREQRRRVRQSSYWPPERWERPDMSNNGETRGRRGGGGRLCKVDDEQVELEDDMATYPMFGETEEYATNWMPTEGDLIEAAFTGADDEEYWALARVDSFRNHKSVDISFVELGNVGKGYYVNFLRPLPKSGDVVEAQYRGTYNEWYRAIVTSVRYDEESGGRWDVSYLDGEKDRSLPRRSIRTFVPFEVGEMVQMLWKDKDEEYWVDSIVLKTTSSLSSSKTENVGGGETGETLTMKHFDGEIVSGVRPTSVRRVRWEFKRGDDVAVAVPSIGKDEDEDEDGDDEWIRGVVSDVRVNGRYDVKFDNGDVDECRSWKTIRFQWAMGYGGDFDEDGDFDDDDENDDNYYNDGVGEEI